VNTVLDAVYVALGVLIVIYAIGAVIAAIGDRPAIVRRSDTGMWTAARSYNGARHWPRRRSQTVRWRR
jgi:hypothetical protein